MVDCHYTVTLEPEEDGGYHASCPTLPGCHSQGDSYDEAVANITEAAQLYVESLKAHGAEVPIEDVLIKADSCRGMTPIRPQVTAKDLARVARELGFELDRQKVATPCFSVLRIAQGS